jgi:hypothetical protein
MVFAHMGKKPRIRHPWKPTGDASPEQINDDTLGSALCELIEIGFVLLTERVVPVADYAPRDGRPGYFDGQVIG